MQEHKISLQEPPAGYRYKLDENWFVQYRKPEIGEYFLNYLDADSCDFVIEAELLILEKIPRWRAKIGDSYWTVPVQTAGKAFAVKALEMNYHIDDDRWSNGNYYQSQNEAEQVAEKINAIINGEV